MLSASWYKLGSLAALQAAISLSWLIYNVYLAKLLVSYGFPASWAVTLLVIENALAVVLEPLLGGLSDRAYRWMATKFGFVALGVILASALFVLIPAVVVFKDTFVAIRWILPGLLVAWAAAMTIFRSPAISLIGQYAFASDLPFAMSFLTLAGGLVGAIRPISQNFLLSLGAPVAFTVGSVVLLVAAGLLRYFNPPTPTLNQFQLLRSTPLLHYGLVLAMGLGVAGGTRCLMESLTKSLKLYFPQIDFSWGLSTIILTMAIAAVPGGFLASKLGNRSAMLWGLGTTIAALAIMAFVSQPMLVGLAIFLIALCFSVVPNGVIPLALSLFPPGRSGLAVGLYFGGFSAGISLASSFFNPPTNVSLLLGAIMGIGSLLLAMICILQAPKPPEDIKILQ